MLAKVTMKAMIRMILRRVLRKRRTATSNKMMWICTSVLPYLADMQVHNLTKHAVCRCQYVRSSKACKAEQHYIAYLQHFYCAGGAIKWLLFAGYLLWMLILFYALSEVAESFLVPAVEVSAFIKPAL